MSQIDLHIHTCYSSDGELSVQSILDMADRKGMRVIAIADHNGVQGAREAQAMQQKHAVRVIPAIEIDCVYQGIDLHVLGYGIDLHDSRYDALQRDIDQQMIDNGEQIITMIEALGIRVDRHALKQLVPDNIIVPEAIAEVALADPDNALNPLLLPYREHNARSDNPYVNFYWDWCSQGKPAYVPMRFMSLTEAIELIHDTGGYAVLAHPGNNLKNSPDLAADILAIGCDGIEAFSSYHTAKQNRYFYDMAIRLNRFFTLGSDFHGKAKPAIVMGNQMPPFSDEDILKQFPPVLAI